MVEGIGQPVTDAVQLNRLRFQVEEWTDQLLAHLGECPGSLQYCHRASRLSEWATDLAVEPPQEFRSLDFQMRMMGLRRWLAKLHSVADANGKLNAAIGEAAMAMLRPEWFDSFGCLKSLATHRMQSIVNETDGAVAALLHTDKSSSPLLEARDSLERYRRSNSSDQFGD